MNLTYENGFLRLEVKPTIARWSVHGRHRNSPIIDDIHIFAQYYHGHNKIEALDRWMSPAISDPEIISSPHGQMHQFQISIGPDQGNVHYSLIFALPDEHPILLWKLSVENKGD